MIKLINILSELQINTPGITLEKVQDYYKKNILNNNKKFYTSKGWIEYKQLCKPYCEKYDLKDGYISFYGFKKLSKSDLIKFYNQMRALVHKHVGTEMLNELQVAIPSITNIKTKDIQTWCCIKSTVDNIIKVDELVDGIKIFNKYLYLLGAKVELDILDSTHTYDINMDNKYLVFPIENFEPTGKPTTWFKDDMDLSYDPITMKNIYVLK